jgi:hapalindole-type alkaloid chlorinase
MPASPPIIMDIPADRLRSPCDVLNKIARKQVDVLIVRQFYSTEQMALVKQRLEQKTGLFPSTSFPPEFHAHFMGQCLDLADPSLTEYFSIADQFREACQVLFEGLPDYEKSIHQLLSNLGSGLPVDVPQGPHGERYAVATIRWLLDGGFIPPHCEREQVRRPPYHHLRTLIRAQFLFSYYLVISPALEGGELFLSALQWEDLSSDHFQNQRTNVSELVQTYPSYSYQPAPGDLILFDGGNWVHWINACKGSQTRWTMGGFVSPVRPGGRLFSWS